MKPQHTKQNSLEFKVGSSLNNDAYILKTQTLVKTYRKKTHPNDSNSFLHLYNTPSTLARYAPNRQGKKSVSKISDHRSMQKKQHPKLVNEKSIERLKAVYKPNEAAPIDLKFKIGKLVNILCIKPEGGGKDIIRQVYQANQSFQNQLKERKRLDIYDAIDEMLAKLVENYTSIIEQIAIKGYGFASECIGKYQAHIAQLQRENKQLKSLLQFQINKHQVQMMEVQNRIYEQFEKNQWGTFILNELSRKALNLDDFVRHSEVYIQAKKQYFRNISFHGQNKGRIDQIHEKVKMEGIQNTRSILVEPLNTNFEEQNGPKLRNFSQFS